MNILAARLRLYLDLWQRLLFVIVCEHHGRKPPHTSGGIDHRGQLPGVAPATLETENHRKNDPKSINEYFFSAKAFQIPFLNIVFVVKLCQTHVSKVSYTQLLAHHVVSLLLCLL